MEGSECFGIVPQNSEPCINCSSASKAVGLLIGGKNKNAQGLDNVENIIYTIHGKRQRR